MCFKREKYDNEAKYGKVKVTDSIRDNRVAIEENVKLLGVLKTYVEDVPEVFAKLDDIEKRYKYVSPSADPEKSKVDKKIRNALEDLKVILAKAQHKDKFEKADDSIIDAVNELKTLIAER